eukprot:TRINITY_DN2761_c0_g2_i3.p1 TRINITY_DN2761_c0_g2~~TRINITY_DN2761_c0_g2_i3.p1  ORF type:complete len:323 (-),score=76.52 TRINITY_DN2761_c0_g2_i3:224-1192(-)
MNDELQTIEHSFFLEKFLVFLLPILEEEERIKETFRLLEVGAGNGLFASLLLTCYERHKERREQEKKALRPLELFILDSSAEAVEKARGRGLRTTCTSFLDFCSQREENAEKYDCVLFTKSLHHIFPLNQAVREAKMLLKPRGHLYAEEFARDKPDEKTCSFFYDIVDILSLSGAFHDPKRHHHHHHHHHLHHHHHHTESSETAPKKNEGEVSKEKKEEKQERKDSPSNDHKSPVQRWEDNLRHEPPLPTQQELIEAFNYVFGSTVVQVESDLPFLYHLLGAGLEKNEKGEKILKKFMEIERRKIKDGEIIPIGLIIRAAHV